MKTSNGDVLKTEQFRPFWNVIHKNCTFDLDVTNLHKQLRTHHKIYLLIYINQLVFTGSGTNGNQLPYAFRAAPCAWAPRPHLKLFPCELQCCIMASPRPLAPPELQCPTPGGRGSLEPRDPSCPETLAGPI